MPSRLSHCLLLSFIGLALVQISYANTLHTGSATKQWTNQVNTESYVEAAIEELEKIKFPLVQQTTTVISPITCFNGDDDSYTSFGNAVGQFGTSDFSIGFWIETTESATQLFDVIGNRDSGAHGNYVQVRMYPQAYACFAEAGSIAVEIDQDSTGTNYVFLSSQGGLNDGKWHHVAVVRQGTSVSLYIDGTLSKQGATSGVTNIDGASDFRVGRSLDSSVLSTRFTGEACYYGIQIENSAWTASEIATTYSTTSPQ